MKMEEEAKLPVNDEEVMEMTPPVPSKMPKKKGRKATKVPRKAPKKKGPKRMSGYQFFLRACLDEMKARYPDASIVLSAVSKLCAENWQSMGDRMRQRFYAEADAVNNSNTQIVKVAKPRRVYRKRPQSSFKIFCKEQRTELKRVYPDFSKDQVACKLANMWITLNPGVKSKYEKLSQRELELYHRDQDLTATKPLEKEVKDVDGKNDGGETTDTEDEESQGLYLEDEHD